MKRNQTDSHESNLAQQSIQFKGEAIELVIQEGVAAMKRNFDNSTTTFKMSGDAKSLVAEYVRLFTLEAIKRSAQEAKNKHLAMKDYRSVNRYMDDIVDDEDFDESLYTSSNNKQRNSDPSEETVPVTLDHLESIASQLFYEFK